MSDVDRKTPRVFIVRHGETEWSKSGRYTGATDLDLTAEGSQQVARTAKQLVGRGKLVDPASIEHTWISPRKRAMQTFEQLFGRCVESENAAKFTLTEDFAEWDYGDYEGLKVGEIRASRKERGLDQEKEWNIWQDGCEGGESMWQVTQRLDKVIKEIRTIHEACMSGATSRDSVGDVVIVAHGLILRAFAKMWLGSPVDAPLEMILPPGAMGILRYVLPLSHRTWNF
ncbi:hypothetical protein MBLNU230_g7118t2 [Neophaeotheca triangularis]